MYEWSEEHLAIREAMRRFVEEEVMPHIDEIEHEGVPPYDIIRKLYSTFGMDEMARESFKRALERKQAGEEGRPERRGGSAAMQIIPTIELCRVSPGLVTSMGVSTGLAGGTIMKGGTPAQMERWGLDLMTFDKVGAWAITEPDSGSDAIGGMRTTAVRDGDEYVINGSKTWITNGPYADTIVLYVKLDEGDGTDIRNRKVLTFILDSGMEGLTQSKPMRKMGQKSSPTGELFFTDLRVGRDRLLGEVEDRPGGGRESAKDNFTAERAGLAAMSLGVIERCQELCIDYAKERMLWGKPIGDFQLIQLKLANMEVARQNCQNLVFRYIEMSDAGKSPTLAEASAMKYYAAKAATDVAMEAIQLFGGNGYISEYRVEQLARDAKVFQIYGGTDEIQITHIAKDLLRR